MKPKAIVITNGFLKESDAKTAHGLIRGTDRFTIAAVIDPVYAGQDAGEVLDGKHRNIPVIATAQEAVNSISDIQYCIIGVATHGGVLPPEFISIIEACKPFTIEILCLMHASIIEINSGGNTPPCVATPMIQY